MYLEHFGFLNAPFNLTPQTHFYFPAEKNQQALLSVLAAVARREGIIKITGEVGTGKTLMCRLLLAELQNMAHLAYLAMPANNPDALFLAVLHELRGHIEGHETPQTALQRHLLDLTAGGKRAVLVIDEAQAFGRDGLEAIRLLSNLETETQKLITIVLFGQPELDEMLQAENLRQLQQRITFSFQTTPLTINESLEYLTHRLVQASESRARALSLISGHAMRTIVHAARGIPRLLNILTDKALLHAYGRGASKVDRRDVKAALDEHKLTIPAQRAHWLVYALVALIVIILIIGARPEPVHMITSW
ncbi:MAG: ExeA family protein [Bdellovibrionales bacterium]